MKIAVFASGTGTNFNNLIRQKDIEAEFSLLVSDKVNAKALEIAKENGIKTFAFNPKEYNKKEDYEKEIINILEENKIDLLVLAGYMRILSREFIEKFRDRIINIHPSYLPHYKGANGIKDAYNDGKNIFGVSVHYVNEEVDGGEIILQERLFGMEGLTLEEVTKKVHELEYKLYPMALKMIIK